MLGTIAGCGDTTSTIPRVTAYPVKGKVLLPDGNPLTQGTVTFVPGDLLKGREAAGKVGSDGSFTLSTDKAGDGAAEGQYSVRIDSEAGVPTGGKGRGRLLVPEKYGDESTSGLTVTVKAGENNLEPFRLDNKPATKTPAGVNKERD
jgi:hypothetical protein